METRFLKTFLSVVESSSIAAAARKENITPSAVVQRLRALEDEIGAVLVRRAGHSMRPTEAGSSVIETTRRIVEAAESMQTIANQKEEIGTIRIGVIHSMITGLLPEILTTMKERRPGIQVEVQPGQSSDLYQKMGEGHLDAAILVEPPFAIPKEYGWYELRQDPLIVLTSINETETDPLALLRSAPFIRYDRKHWGGRPGDTYLRRIRLNPKDKYELDSLEAIVVLVNRGLGVSLVPDWFPPWPEGLFLRKLPLEGAPSRGVGLIFPRLASNERLVRAFAEEARDAAKLKEASLVNT
ncbi:LysR family transcriptional regulator [Phyllobacterium brassicacearum]|uniref:LysR family transcriptional regulator n=1 Tax=Phyllobacterium brassicacearum TaxID=314235 RepID=A0A2P7BUG5_9HYPH|nr:LysR family transcriptional regulator [Phyllobacterium brassicacearum]PSH70115.1 LysR family transcriptional regulator [Phyllobacterium brassicacearum]TDQ34016.1 DNA-binding transcriptional LysR family regulator [Phyllobacterium brassicacearum]